MKASEGDVIGTLGPCSVANLDHSEEGMTPKAIKEAGGDKEGFSGVYQCTSLSLDGCKLQVSVWHGAFIRR